MIRLLLLLVGGGGGRRVELLPGMVGSPEASVLSPVVWGVGVGTLLGPEKTPVACGSCGLRVGGFLGAAPCWGI